MTNLRTILVAVVLSHGIAQTALGDNLIDVYRLTLANDKRYAGAIGSYKAGVEKYDQGLSGLLPTLSVDGEKMYSYGEIEYTDTTSFDSGDRRYEDSRYSLTLTQPLYRKENFAVYEQGKAQSAAAGAQFDIAKQDLILRTAQAYFEVLSAQQNLSTTTAHVASMEAQANEARRKLAVGAATRIEVNETKARADVARAQEIAARDELINKRYALWRMSNAKIRTLDELPLGFTLDRISPNDVDELMKIAENENFQLQVLRYNLEAATQEVERARAGHYPNLDLVARYSSDYSTGSVYTASPSDTSVKSAGLRLDIPLYQGGLVDSRVREALGALEKARADLEDARRDVESQIARYLHATVSGAERVRALEQALNSSNDAARATRLGFNVGTRILVEVLDAEREAYDVALDLINARQEYVLNWLRLKANIGTLNEDDLKTLNSYLVSPAKG